MIFQISFDVFFFFLESEQAAASQSVGGQRLVTADGTYATQSALSAPGITSLVKKDDEKRYQPIAQNPLILYHYNKLLI